MSLVRARFAPSPTGTLHLGSVRTALLNWLFVRAHGGKLLLRIDDTDTARSTLEFEQAILDDLRWLALDWDEGPVHQSQRTERYEQALTRLPVKRADGAYEFQGRVIARADGSALYHLATAVDDVEDSITHVLRGRDHLSNTEFQAAIIRALGAEPPSYVHAPLLVFPGGVKASKRADQGGLTVSELRLQGFAAPAICNALALSLADFGTDEVMLSLEEMAGRFDLSRLHSADSQFDEAKLRWLCGQHIRAMDDEVLATNLAEFGSAALPVPALAAARTGGETFTECAATAGALIDPPPPDSAALAAISQAEAGEAYRTLDGLVAAWPPEIEQAVRAFADLKGELRGAGLELGPCLRGLRAMLSGRTEGPEFPLLLACVTQARWDAARP